MKIASDFDDRLITIEDAQNQVRWHFAVGKKKGFRFISVQPDRPGEPVPSANSQSYAAAELAAQNFAQQNGWV